MKARDPQDALELLSTERIERLVDRLEADPEIELSVGAWTPQCPMVLAGFDPGLGHRSCPERAFADAWDRLARTAQPWWLPWRSHEARRADVQSLLRTGNAVLARRALATGERTPSRPAETGPLPRPRRRRA